MIFLGFLNAEPTTLRCAVAGRPVALAHQKYIVLNGIVIRLPDPADKNTPSEISFKYLGMGLSLHLKLLMVFPDLSFSLGYPLLYPARGPCWPLRLGIWRHRLCSASAVEFDEGNNEGNGPWSAHVGQFSVAMAVLCIGGWDSKDSKEAQTAARKLSFSSEACRACSDLICWTPWLNLSASESTWQGSCDPTP